MQTNGLMKKDEHSTLDNVTFVHRYGPQMASYRYRAQIPAMEIGAKINEGDAEIVVFSKPHDLDLALAKQVKDNGGKVIVDICDPHDYTEIVKLSDTIVVASEVLQQLVADVYNRDSVVIPDPYEVTKKKPHASRDWQNVCWTGHNTNLKDLQPHMEYLTRAVTGPKVPNGFTHWSIENEARMYSESGIALLPTSPESHYKSNNRLLNAVMSGCFVLAEPRPTVMEFKELMWVGPIHTGIRWVSEFHDELDDLVREAQEYIEVIYSPDMVGQAWRECVTA